MMDWSEYTINIMEQVPERQAVAELSRMKEWRKAELIHYIFALQQAVVWQGTMIRWAKEEYGDVWMEN